MTDYIPSVYCYCDQCCERCPLTARCAVFAGSAALDVSVLEPGSEGFWTVLMDQFYAAHPDFPRDAVEGIDLRAPTEEELAEASRAAEALEEQLRSDPAWNAFSNYRAALYALLEDVSYWRVQARSRAMQAALGLCDPNELMREANQVTEWLHVLRRHADGGEERLRSALALLFGPRAEWALAPEGLAKVILLGFAESRTSLTALYGLFPDEDRLLPLFARLAEAERAIDMRIPGAMAFVRPGFDEPAALEGAGAAP